MGLKTYSHLMPKGRVPSAYEVVTSGLLYYPERGFELPLPLSDWYARHQGGSPFRAGDWEAFADPPETTYGSYVALQRASEAHAEGLFRSIESDPSPPACAEAWLRLYAPLRYFFHALQMSAAYVGQMAPSGRIVVACAFQVADEVRRVQRIAYRLALVRRASPDAAARSERAWRAEPGLQPLRELAERLLVTYDWGEAFAALCLCVKPALDALVWTELPALLLAQGDTAWREICFSLSEDGAWHQAWAKALVQAALSQAPENRRVLSGWRAAWQPRVEAAVRGLCALAGDEGARASAALGRAGQLMRELGMDSNRG